MSIDLSFISLLRVFPRIIKFLDYKSNIYVLIKPQFEVLKKDIFKGIVNCKFLRKDVLQVILMSVKMLGLEIRGVMKSNMIGLNGNIEYLALFMN